MLDFNHILLFLACISSLLLLGQTWKRGGLNRGWRLAALVVLLVTGAAWIVQPETAGFVGGGAWLALLVLPLFGLRKAAQLAAQQRYAAAWKLARALRFLHPADGLLERSRLLRALDIAQRGDIASALALLAPLGNNQTNVGRQAIAQIFRIRGDWNGLLKWLRGELPPGIMQTDFGLQPLCLRALGETGARDQLLLEFTSNARSMNAAAEEAGLYDLNLLPVLAFTGRVGALSHLLETKLRKFSRETKEFWIGTSELAASKTMAARSRLEKLLANTSDALVRTETTHRLEGISELPLPLSRRPRPICFGASSKAIGPRRGFSQRK